jgi:proteasome lid subunit RPN8/RPN11
MQSHAESIYPEECCGLLLGQMDRDLLLSGNLDAGKMVIEVLPVLNSWGTNSETDLQDLPPTPPLDNPKQRRYSISPEVMLKAQREARDRHLNIIGIYHSHTDNPAIPSSFDLALAWPQYSYIIISVLQGKASDIRSWSLDSSRQFQPEEIIPVPPTLN